MLIIYTLLFFRVVMGLIFTISVIGKLRSMRQFISTLESIRFFQRRWLNIIASIVIFVEFMVVWFMIMGGDWLMIGFGTAALLLAVFSAALVSVLVRGIQVPCNCFGTSNKTVSSVSVWRNIALLLFACCGFVVCYSFPQTNHNVTLLEGGFVLFTSAMVVLICTQLDEITILVRGQA